jgi:uncharacterized protein YcbX
VSSAGSIAEIWRYPVKSMGGERLTESAIDVRGLHADRMWAVRDVELGTFTTARRWPILLQCSARFDADPAGRPAGPGDVLEVVVTLPDGEELPSADPAIHDRLSELIGKPARLEPLPALSDKKAYRTPQATKADMRRQFLVADDEPLPDFSMFPISKLAELARYATPVGALYDAYPLLVMTTASLRAMEQLAPGSSFDVRRFRPNVVVEAEGTGLVEFGWCGGRLQGTEVILSTDIPAVRCSIPTREQGDLPADPDVLRTLKTHADRCLGVYTTVERGGDIAVGETLEFYAPSRRSAAGAFKPTPATRIKRGALRAFEVLMPRGR